MEQMVATLAAVAATSEEAARAGRSIFSQGRGVWLVRVRCGDQLSEVLNLNRTVRDTVGGLEAQHLPVDMWLVYIVEGLKKIPLLI